MVPDMDFIDEPDGTLVVLVNADRTEIRMMLQEFGWTGPLTGRVRIPIGDRRAHIRELRALSVLGGGEFSEIADLLEKEI